MQVPKVRHCNSQSLMSLWIQPWIPKCNILYLAKYCPYWEVYTNPYTAWSCQQKSVTLWDRIAIHRSIVFSPFTCLSIFQWFICLLSLSMRVAVSERLSASGSCKGFSLTEFSLFSLSYYSLQENYPQDMAQCFIKSHKRATGRTTKNHRLIALEQIKA